MSSSGTSFIQSTKFQHIYQNNTTAKIASMTYGKEVFSRVRAEATYYPITDEIRQKLKVSRKISPIYNHQTIRITYLT